MKLNIKTSLLIATSSLLLFSCKIQEAPGAYAKAKGKPKPKEEVVEKQTADIKPIETPKVEPKPIITDTIVPVIEKPKTDTVKPIAIEETVKDTIKSTPPPAVEKEITRSEKFTVVEPQQQSLLKTYHVVIGSFGVQQNAENLKASMTNETYTPIIVKNEQGMFRVILKSFDDYASARAEINLINTKFSDAWVLIAAE